MFDLEQAIMERHSTRLFLRQPVPRESCVEVSITGYPDVIRAQLDIPAELSLLCGVAIDYPDPNFPANKLHVVRESIAKNVLFIET